MSTPTLPIRPRVLRRALVATGAGAILAGTAIGLGAGEAKADRLSDRYANTYGSAICSVIAQYPSDAGVTGVALGILDDGLTGAQTGAAIYRAVADQCPRYLGVILHWANSVSPDSTAAASAPAPATKPAPISGGVGGVIR